MRYSILLLILVLSGWYQQVFAQKIRVNGQPARLDIRAAGSSGTRITLKPLSYKYDFTKSPATADLNYGPSIISLTHIDRAVSKPVGNLMITVNPKPLSIVIKNRKGRFIQKILFTDSGKMSFQLGIGPILGLGEGGQLPAKGVDWKALPAQYDRKGRYYKMQPRWQSDAYGSRNPVPVLINPDNWAMFIVAPWVEVDLTGKRDGVFIPWKPASSAGAPQTFKNQGLNLGKGLPPVQEIIPGMYDFFVFDAHSPAMYMKDFSLITGPAALPPKWALGYMQSHRTLEDETQMIGIVDTFRKKQLPIDAVIYLGTGFTPRGWNKKQPSFESNPEVFKRDPKEFIANMHERHVKVVLHMVPWDRDKLPGLHGNIPAKPGEIIDQSHIQSYWNEHIPLMKAGVDAFWPDEGDWFNLYERIKRHQLYYQGQLSYNPDLRPWSLQRNGYPGIAQWGGWVWSGDTQSSWKTLETQIAVGLNYAVSIGPYWGTDIGGFFANKELTAELYTRWYQFGAFCPSFRGHGTNWMSRLPWIWGTNSLGPLEGASHPLESELNNKAIEPIVKKYDQLRYQLLPYTYTLTWEARMTGLPLMRALWLQYPNDEQSKITDNEYMWGDDMLIAPIYEKGATTRNVYLPKSTWYDWWTNVKVTGNQTITRMVDLSVMPIYVRAGAIIPVDPVRQYTGERVNEPTTLKIFTGTDGKQVLYEDDGISQDYLKGKYNLTQLLWNEKKRQLIIAPDLTNKGNPYGTVKTFKVQLIPDNKTKVVVYKRKSITVKF